MAKKEAFGLSLLDVLSNALVAAIVLMMISATFVKVLSELEETEDVATGESEVRSAIEFKEVSDPLRGARQLNIALELFGGKPDVVRVSYRAAAVSDATRCINIAQGVYKKHYWLVTRDCNWQEGEEWHIILDAPSPDAVPDSIGIHANFGLVPVRLDPDIRMYKPTVRRTGTLRLVTVTEQERIPEISN
ncbi:MAG: hypothetical protein KIS77_16890 [Saprospiraceae bacterium]|nr:hypothetical protein [Saprospiraceae bacterium]